MLCTRQDSSKDLKLQAAIKSLGYKIRAGKEIPVWDLTLSILSNPFAPEIGSPCLQWLQHKAKHRGAWKKAGLKQFKKFLALRARG